MKILNTADYETAEDLKKLTSFEQEALYNGFDCCVTLEVLDVLLAEMENYAVPTYRRSLALREPILEMTMRGIRVDQRQRAKVLFEFEQKKKFLSNQLARIFKEGFGLELNYRSPKDMKYFFYEVLKIKPIRKRNQQGKFAPTVNRDAIERLQVNFYAEPICMHLLLLRDLDKKIGFLKTGIDPDGRMRATFNIAGTKTGRLNSSQSEFGTGTNLQNIDRSLRTIFIPDDGMKFLNIDLEQGDSRNMGAMMWNVFYDTHGPEFAGSYLDACESGDLHTMVTAMTWPELGWPEGHSDLKAMKEVAEQIFYRQDSYRQTSKKLGHGSNYNGQASTMALHTKSPVHVIREFQIKYFKSFQCIPAYHAWIGVQLKEYAMLTNLHGRTRHFFGRASDNNVFNEAVAFPSQSDTADAVISAMLQVWGANFPIHILNQVHDSLLFQVPEEMCDDLTPEILKCAEDHLILKGGRDFTVPNEAKIGWNWADFDKRNPDKNPHGLINWSADGDKRKAPKLNKYVSILER